MLSMGSVVAGYRIERVLGAGGEVATDNNDLTTMTYRRARHRVSLLHPHPVFVTTYRRPVFTGACVRAGIRGHLWSPSYFAVSCGGAPLSIMKQYIVGQARPL
jgi:REP element-mobilizing transposase RayT